MKKNWVGILVLGIFLSATFIFAAPGLPHIFYGSISYEDNVIPEGTEITASIGTEDLSVVGYVGENNGYGPIQIFPTTSGGTIHFYIGGVETEETIPYQENTVNEGDEEIPFDLTLTSWPTSWAYCGDGVKDAGEQCDGVDFGEGFPTCESIKLYYYGLSGYTEGTLSCSDGCTFDTSNCSQPVVEETTTTTTETSSGGSSGGGGGGGSSGGSYYVPKENVSINETEINLVGLSSDLNETEQNSIEENEEFKQTFFRATGSAISDFSKTKTGKGVIVVIGIVFVIGIFMFFSTKRKNKFKKN